MRTGFLLAIAGVCIPLSAGLRAPAETFKIASFADSRSYKYFMGVTQTAVGSSPYVAGHDWYSTMRNWLTTPGVFGPGIAVSLHEISDARTDLAGQDFDLLIMNEVVPLAGSAADEEADAIAEFVLGGGCLAIIADTLDGGKAAAMGNKTLAAIDGGSELAGRAGRYGGFVFTDHPETESAFAGRFSLDPGSTSSLVWGGGFNYQIDGTGQADPFAPGQSDVLNGARFGATDHVRVDPGEWSQVIGKRAITGGPNPILSNIFMEITGDRIDAGLPHTGAGNVLVLGDTIFANDMVQPIAPGFANADPSKNNNNHNNARILLNFVYQQAIPEPAGFALLAIGLAVLLGGYCWRRGAS